MKKLLMAALVVVTMGTSAFAAPKKVSSFVKNNFQSEFSQASEVTWLAEDAYAKATFTLNNVRMEAFYSLTGEIIGTSKAVSLDDIPVAAKRSIAKKFGEYDVKEAIYFEGTDEAAYFISAENEKESIVLKVSDHSNLSIFKRNKK
ncbi:MAG: hypothetical protein JWQ40_713 [Segetibacter sp.]|nr:hypothetical protein [Segetibacter sp.]